MKATPAQKEWNAHHGVEKVKYTQLAPFLKEWPPQVKEQQKPS